MTVPESCDTATTATVGLFGGVDGLADELRFVTTRTSTVDRGATPT